MTTHPHPLAIEAANKIWGATSGFLDEERAQFIIQTTALDPVLKAGEEMVAFLDHQPPCDKIEDGSPICTCGLDKALLAWRKVANEGLDTTPKVDSLPSGLPSDALEGVDSGKEARKGVL